MGTEGIKIEDEIVNSMESITISNFEMNPLEMPTLIWRVAQFLDRESVRRLRLINSQWNHEIMLSRIPTEFKFKFNGIDDTPLALHYKIQILFTSVIRWKNFEFENMDFDAQEVRSMLDVVLNKYGKSCNSISLSNCNIQMSDFVRIIAKAQELRELRIVECPTLLRTEANILQCWKYMPQFLKNMKNITSLEFTSISTQKNVRSTVETWLYDTFQLEVLKICTVESPMPCYVMNRMLQNNFRTLTTLSILSYDFDQHTLNAFSQISCLRLKNIELCRCTIANPLLFAKFLGGQLALETLFFENMKLQSLTLSSIGLNTRLKQVILTYCEYDLDSLEPLKHSDSLERFCLTGDDRSTEILRAFITRADGSLVLPGFRTLEITLTSENEKPNNKWIQYIPTAFPNLTSLCLQNLKNLPKSIIKIFNLPYLTCLELPGCQLEHEHLFGRQELPEYPAFQNIQSLNLAETQINDESIQTIGLMGNLRKLDLRSTPVTKNCLQILGELMYGQLDYLNICDIYDDHFTEEEYAGLRQDLFNEDAKFLCDLGDDDEEFEEYGDNDEEFEEYGDNEDYYEYINSYFS